MSTLKGSIQQDRVPAHVAVIMDGNGRWARKQGKDRTFGHSQGVKAVRNTTEAAAEVNVQYLTFYAFSTENWKRPAEEINALMELLVKTIKNEMDKLMENNICLHAIGNLSKLPSDCANELSQAIEMTKENSGLNVILALSYSARWDIVNAARKIALKVQQNAIDSKTLDDSTFKSFLSTSPFPDPELLIRTSGESRISNFLLWELAYTELHFCQKNWPEFEKEDFYSAILDYQSRERRFGKVSEQSK